MEVQGGGGYDPNKDERIAGAGSKAISKIVETDATRRAKRRPGRWVPLLDKPVTIEVDKGGPAKTSNTAVIPNSRTADVRFIGSRPTSPEDRRGTH